MYSEYENEFEEVPDDDMSTVAPSDASVLLYSIEERIARDRARDRAIEAARQRSDTMFRRGPHGEAHITYLHRAWTARNAVDLHSSRLREVARDRQAASVQTTNDEARSRTSDTATEVTDATGRVLSEAEVRYWEAVVRQNTEIEARWQYVEARRRATDTESNWSTNAVCPSQENP